METRRTEALMENARARRDWRALARYAEECLTQDPEHRRARFFLADALSQLGSPDIALDILTGLRREAPEDVRTLARLAHLQVETGQPVQAERTLATARALAPLDAEVIEVSCVAAIARRDADALEARIEDYRAHVGHIPSVLLLEAQVALLRRDHPTARARLAEVLQHQPEHLRAHTQIAEIDLGSGDLRSARAHALIAAGIDPADKSARNLARVLQGADGWLDRSWLRLCLWLWMPESRISRLIALALVALITLRIPTLFLFCLGLYFVLRLTSIWSLTDLKKQLEADEPLVELSPRY